MIKQLLFLNIGGFGLEKVENWRWNKTYDQSILLFVCGNNGRESENVNVEYCT